MQVIFQMPTYIVFFPESRIIHRMSFRSMLLSLGQQE